MKLSPDLPKFAMIKADQEYAEQFYLWNSLYLILLERQKFMSNLASYHFFVNWVKDNI